SRAHCPGFTPRIALEGTFAGGVIVSAGMINSRLSGGIVRPARVSFSIHHAAGAAAIAALIIVPGLVRAFPPQETKFRSDTNLVVIPVSVTDNVNRFVLGFQKQDFHLLDDGVEQSIVHFSGEDVPLSIGLAFDESGSMDYKLRTS